MQNHSCFPLAGHASASLSLPPAAYMDRRTPSASPGAKAQHKAFAADLMATFAERYRHANATVANDKRRFFDYFLAICQGISVGDAAYIYNVSTCRASEFRRRLLEKGPDALFTFFETTGAKAKSPPLQPNAICADKTRPPNVPAPTGQLSALHLPAPNRRISTPSPALPFFPILAKASSPLDDEPPLSDTGIPTFAQYSYFLRYTIAHRDQISPANKRRFTAFMMVCEGQTQSHVCAEIGINHETLERDADLLACAGAKALFDHLLSVNTTPAKKTLRIRDSPDVVLDFTELTACVDSLGPEPSLADGLIPTEAQRAYYSLYAEAHMDQLPSLTKPRAKILALVCQGVSQRLAAQHTHIPESSVSTYLRILARRGPKATFAHFFSPGVIGSAKKQKPWQRRPLRSAQDRAFGAVVNRVQKADKEAKVSHRRATYQARSDCS